jgi:hypothetical protein
VQGLSFTRQAVTKENFGRALALWQKALALDPDAPPLNAMVGMVHIADERPLPKVIDDVKLKDGIEDAADMKSAA